MEKMRTEKGKAYGDALVPCILEKERNGSKEIRVYIHIDKKEKYVEYSVSPLGYPKDIKRFYTLAQLENALDNKVACMYVPNHAALNAFSDWNVCRLKEKPEQINATISYDTITKVNAKVAEMQYTFPGYTLSDAANDALALYFGMPEYSVKRKPYKKIRISLGENYLHIKRQTERAHMMDAYVFCENRHFKIRINPGYRLKELVGDIEDVEKLKNISAASFSSTEEIEGAIGEFVMPDHISPVEKIKVSPSALADAMIKDGWEKMPVKDAPEAEGTNRVYVYMKEYKTPVAAKAELQGGRLTVSYCGTAISDMRQLGEAICDNKDLGEDSVDYIKTTKTFLYDALSKNGFSVVLADSKRPVHANIHPVLSELVGRENRSAVMEEAFKKYVE